MTTAVILSVTFLRSDSLESHALQHIKTLCQIHVHYPFKPYLASLGQLKRALGKGTKRRKRIKKELLRFYNKIPFSY